MSATPSESVFSREELPEALRATAVLPGDEAYASVQSVYSVPGEPAVILPVTGVSEAQAALALAAEHRELPLSVRSGGHGINGSGTNRGGIVIDLSGSREVTVVDEGARIVRVGPGVPSGVLLGELKERGWVVPSPTFGDTAVGGVATAGGIGLLARRYGLTLDRVVAFEVVLADGRVVRAAADSEPELFWALRGGGATTGVVTAVEFAAIELPEVLSATTKVAPTSPAELAEVLFAWAEAAQSAPGEVTSAFLANRSKDDGGLRVMINTVFAGADSEAGREALAPFGRVSASASAEFGVQATAYASTVFTPGAPHVGKRSAVFRNAFSPALDREAAGALASLLEHDEVITLNLRGFGGAVADVAADATAFSYRDFDYLVSVWGAVTAEAEFDALWEGVRGQLSGVYAGYTDQGDAETLALAFPGATGERLARAQQAYDPTGLLSGTIAG